MHTLTKFAHDKVFDCHVSIYIFGFFCNLIYRDFFKLCRRIPTQLDFTKPASALKIFQEAFDLFIASQYDPGN